MAGAEDGGQEPAVSYGPENVQNDAKYRVKALVCLCRVFVAAGARRHELQ